MNRILVVIAFLLILNSCQKRVKEYYENGNIKSVYFESNGKKNGLHKKFYNNEVLKEVHIYKNGMLSDSSIYYHSPPYADKIERIQFWGDSTHFQINFRENGNKFAEGHVLKTNLEMPIGKWSFYTKNKIDSIIEYVKIMNHSYMNQVWMFNSRGDTLQTRGNYCKITHKDTVNVGEVLRIRFQLYQPYFSHNSDIEVILPVYDRELKNDFSNIFEIEHNTYPSLKNDGIPHPEIPDYVLQNQFVEIGLVYEEPGHKHLRGILVEYIQSLEGRTMPKDSVNRVERQIFFNETIFVKDSVKQI